MLKKIGLLLIGLFLISGCGCTIKQNDDIERFYLDDKYYGSSEFIKINEEELNNLDNGNYLLFTYNNYCSLPISCEKIFEKFMQKYNIAILSMPFENFRNTKYYETVKYAPSVLIIKDDEILAYLDANSDNDLDKYQELSSFEEWLNNYIYFSKK